MSLVDEDDIFEHFPCPYCGGDGFEEDAIDNEDYDPLKDALPKCIACNGDGTCSFLIVESEEIKD